MAKNVIMFLGDGEAWGPEGEGWVGAPREGPGEPGCVEEAGALGGMFKGMGVQAVDPRGLLCQAVPEGLGREGRKGPPGHIYRAVLRCPLPSQAGQN